MTAITIRPAPARAVWTLEQAGVPPLLARLYAARGIREASELDTQFAALIPPAALKGIEPAAELLADAIAQAKRLLIVADYDCDGATACAVGLRALRAFGATVDYLVPDRALGYGLSPAIMKLAAERRPDVIVTVDNGIAAVEGVAEAKRQGIAVVVTDHHLPGDELPAADAIVNPNQPGCSFPSKALAGVGVMFYVMLATRAELRKRGAFADRCEPNLAALLDLVALGTVADVVPLDRNNRILVAQGLERIRAGKMQAGVKALFRVAGREWTRAGTFDLGFALGPRINAAGRLADMALGIECLATDSEAQAMNIAQQLDAINRERRDREADMREDAAVMLDGIDADTRASIALFDPRWLPGVVGILAGRIKESLHRPTFAFARAVPDIADGEIKGSGRSIPGLHLRDALDLIDKRHPGMLARFGGHAAAAGVTLQERDFAAFAQAFEDICRTLLAPAELTRQLETDGTLEAGYRTLEAARLLRESIWGQGFPEPRFADDFEVVNQRLLKDKHLKLTLRQGKARFDAIRFNFVDDGGTTVPERVRAVYRLDINEWNGTANVQLLLDHIEPA